MITTLLIILSVITLRVLIVHNAIVERKVRFYLLTTGALLKIGNHTDGCTTPFKNYIHRWLRHSRELCAAHDFGSLDMIAGVYPGWHNNLITWLAHMSRGNPVYWIWGTVVAVVTLPWVIWRRNWNIETVPFMVFHAIVYLLPILIYILLLIRPT